MSLEIEVFCTHELPPLAEFLASLKSRYERELCRGDSWNDLSVGNARVALFEGAQSAERWPHPHACRLVLAGSGAGKWQDIIFVMCDLVDVCGGAVRTFDVMFDHERRFTDAATAEACLAAVRDAGDLASLRAAFKKHEPLHDGPLFRRCAALALAQAAGGRSEMWEPLVKLAKKEVGYLGDVEHEDKRLVDWLAQRQSEGVKLTAPVRRYISDNAYLIRGSIAH